jgi:uncharacterized membrane protein
VGGGEEEAHHPSAAQPRRRWRAGRHVLGLLFGLIFFVPLLGAAIGAAFGALSGSLADVGIDDTFIKRVRDEITPGTSALFVLTSDAVQDRVRDAFAGQDFELLFTDLSKEQEDNLRKAFGE